MTKKRATKRDRWPKQAWLEQFQPCGCTYVALKRSELMGYCGRHGGDRSKSPLMRIEVDSEADLGYA